MRFDDGPRSPMTPDEFRLLAELIYDHCGILFKEDMCFLLERRLGVRVKALDLPDFMAYYRYLRFDAGRRAELDTAVEALTTNETYFFREPHQLKAFREEILPGLVKERASTRRLRLWSAGCSTGEEAYTLAMLILESGLCQGWDVEIFGSDISRKVLSAARKGTYAKNALREAPLEMVQRYFVADAGRHVVKDEVKALVSFGHLNLLDEHMVAMLARFDAVFCRNVMIYFDLPARRRVLKSFHGRLVPGGFLLLGHSESLIHVTADFELVHLKNDLVYRKPV
ncbi:MAG: protein-glutamate O-methyltransferase CheR [Myxococcales bacterium]